MALRERILLARQSLVVGIDVAKKKHYAQMVDQMGVPVGKPFSFHNTMDGFEHLECSIHQAQAKLGLEQVLIGFEPTGHYHKPLAQWLQDKGYIVVIVGTAVTKNHKEDLDNSPLKSDTKDATLIATLISQGNYLSLILPRAEFAELRVLTNTRRQQRMHLTRLLNNVTALLDEFFPEFSTLFKDKLGLSSIWVMRNCPWPSDILAMPLETLAEKIKEASHFRQGLKKAQALQAAAKRSIGVTRGLASARRQLNLLLDGIQESRKRLEEIEAQMSNALIELGMVDSLLSIPGVGVITAASFLGEIGDPNQYTDWRQVQKLAGLNIVSRSSGEHAGKSHISRRGRSGLRCLLFQATVCLVAKDPQFKALFRYFQTRTRNPLCKMGALIAVSEKLLRIMFCLAQTGRTYDPRVVLGQIREYQIAALAA